MFYNIIVLHHFHGIPELMDSISNDIRYAQLLTLIDLIIEHNLLDNTIFLCSAQPDDKRMGGIKDIAIAENIKWIDYDEDVEHILHSVNFKISPANSNVTIGGTNTAGCVANSIKNWADLGFDIQVCLSMCADYQSDGINGAEKNQKAAVKFYRYIKKHNLISKVDMVYNANELKLRDINNDWMG